MNIAILNGSLKKGGNTDIMCKFLEKSIERKGYKVKVINLHEYYVEPCRNCEMCDDGICPINDDMIEVAKVLKNTDMIFVASPIYWGGITGALKCVIDRLNQDENIYKQIKWGAILLNAEYDSSFSLVYEHLKLIFSYLDIKTVGKIFIDGMKKAGDMNSLHSEKLIDDFFEQAIKTLKSES